MATRGRKKVHEEKLDRVVVYVTKRTALCLDALGRRKARILRAAAVAVSVLPTTVLDWLPDDMTGAEAGLVILRALEVAQETETAEHKPDRVDEICSDSSTGSVHAHDPVEDN